MEKCTLLVMVLCAVHFSRVLCYPNGQVGMVCDSMLPDHGSPSQTSAAPYSISASPTMFAPGDKITVTLQGNGSAFKGFLIEARAIGGDFTVGTFTVPDSSSQGLQCNNVQNSAVSHTSSSTKTIIRVTWIAPAGSGHVAFRATVVKSTSVFWTKVESPTIQSSQISSDNCVSEKICLSNPTECNPVTTASCSFMSCVMATGGGFVFEMSAPSNGYVAIGFSDDQIMGNDDVYMCVLNATGGIEIQHATTTGRVPPIISNLGTVEGIRTSNTNGKLSCSFITRNNIALPSRSTNSLFYIFLATGPVASGKIGKHTRTPFISNDKVDLTATRAQVSAASSPIKVKVHGALMLIAWMTTGSIGMVFARYLKEAAKEPIFGKALWFQVHQPLMGVTVAATIIAFIVIFVEAMGWAYDAGAHPVLGCIVMILSFLQPIIALCRPDPKANLRYIFNWFHALNALVIKIVAVAALFLGFELIDNTSNLWMAKVLGGFVGWEALTILFLELNIHLKWNDVSRYDASERKVPLPSQPCTPPPQPKTTSTARKSWGHFILQHLQSSTTLLEHAALQVPRPSQPCTPPPQPNTTSTARKSWGCFILQDLQSRILICPLNPPPIAVLCIVPLVPHPTVLHFMQYIVNVCAL